MRNPAQKLIEDLWCPPSRSVSLTLVVTAVDEFNKTFSFVVLLLDSNRRDMNTIELP